MLTAGLPSFPRTVGRLSHLISEADAPAHVVAAVIATDPALTALVIGQANATGYATTRLSDAVRHVGLGVVLNTARSAFPIPENQRQQFASCWAQANAVAVLVPILVDHCRIRNRWDEETLHLTGLVHDLGHILALSHFPAEYQRAATRLDAGEDGFPRLLTEELGASPEQLGALAGASWSLPTPMLPVMKFWRRPNLAGDFTDLCAVVHIAHILAQSAGFIAAGDRFVLPFDEWALSALNLRLSDLETVLTRMYESMDELELYEGALRG
jgi:HD-like signal output (HDOD) protein